MKRRSFVKASALTALLATSTTIIKAAAVKQASREFYELRTYDLKNKEQSLLVERYFKDAAIPALNRAGLSHIGVFKELKPGENIKLYVLIPYPSPDALITVHNDLDHDKAYLAAAGPYLNAPASEPAYERIESSLLHAFTNAAKLQVPASKKRIFELRRYEHATEAAGKKKLEMFNDAGEIDIFKRLGFSPVFFGETLIGPARPNLTYMITFDDMEAHDSHWKAFGSDPEWKKISSIPEYSDAKLVSRITSTLLTPCECSQI